MLRVYLQCRQTDSSNFNVGEWLTSLDHLVLHQLHTYVGHAVCTGPGSNGYFADLVALCKTALEAEGGEIRYLEGRRTLRKVIKHFHVLVALATAVRHGLIELNAPMKLSIPEVTYSITDAGWQFTG